MNVNKNTGEVFVFPGPYSPTKKTILDYSNVYEDVYEEIPPYAVDLNTGELINKTPEPIVNKIGVRNVQDYIQSFKDDCDIYKILERVAISGDPTLLNRRVGLFGDFVNLPDNINDLNAYVKKVFNENKDVSKDILEAAINSSLSSVDIQEVIKKHVEQAVIAAQANTNKGDE